MTVVRRPAYVTHSCPQPGDGGFWDNLPSRKAQLKSESARRYLEEHFTTLMKETEERRERLRVFNEQMASSNLSNEDKEQLQAQFAEEESQYSRLSRTRLKSARYQRIKLIGRGGFGDVWLVQDNTTSELFALKVLRKSDIILKDQLVNVRTERDILSTTTNPWVVQLQYSFQDTERLYLVLEYLCGGDLMTVLIKRGRFDEMTAKFFTGEIALALHSIHQMHFLHRDLKPDNVLIASNGHIKLTDFGLSTNYLKQDSSMQTLLNAIQDMILESSEVGKLIAQTHHERGNNAIGTCGYTAPEVFRGQPTTTLSDFWSLGVILYEMLFGFPPFQGKSPQETALRILHFKRALRFPSNVSVSPVAIDLIKNLLCEPEERFKFEQIIAHPFFAGFNFQNVEANIPPMVPIIRCPTDTCHFDDIEPNPEESFGSELPCDDLAEFAFLGYTYKHRPQSMTMARLQQNYT
ncbi:AGC family protein kinase [Tritrichomonas foetus]|uniref:non-specific serine/threonine protein kinase n=1 Tax=Tritrichomonas foetus TaxID=1144522 RepID=A0A1J4J8M0_9EUKA|nr:AGC family protein kinase [Tritrichomonas foetus]|eukprot:OHS95488.1 AGC family protein kinase [Tritrichomonas foetus]